MSGGQVLAAVGAGVILASVLTVFLWAAAGDGQLRLALEAIGFSVALCTVLFGAAVLISYAATGVWWS